MFTTISPFGRRWKSGRITATHPFRCSTGNTPLPGAKPDYKAVTVTTSMDQLIEAAMNQNFVPVVDDRGIFIGIVRRQAIIRYCYEKARTEQQAHEQRIPEYAAVH